MIFILLLVFGVFLSAHSHTVTELNNGAYKWRDSKGILHFSDQPPHLPNKQLPVKTKPYNHRYYSVAKVLDGDTILLNNKQKIRFLGINAPEVNNFDNPAEVGGYVAKQWLQAKLKNQKLRLEEDVEKQDKYKRTLAHVFNKNGQHINLELVKQGLAIVSIYPPNFKYVDELLLAQQNAKKNLLGIWQHEQYAVKKISEINDLNIQGWQRIAGYIADINYEKKYIYLNLSKNFSLKIKHKSAHLFPNLDNYVGKYFEVHGWINKYQNRYTMQVIHPSAMFEQAIEKT